MRKHTLMICAAFAAVLARGQGRTATELYVTNKVAEAVAPLATTQSVAAALSPYFKKSGDNATASWFGIGYGGLHYLAGSSSYIYSNATLSVERGGTLEVYGTLRIGEGSTTLIQNDIFIEGHTDAKYGEHRLATTQDIASAVAPLATTQDIASAFAPLATTQHVAEAIAEIPVPDLSSRVAATGGAASNLSTFGWVQLPQSQATNLVVRLVTSNDVILAIGVWE